METQISLKEIQPTSGMKFDEKGLLPAVVQDAHTGQVLMLAYVNEESLRKTLETGQTWFYSRERQCLWHKGETSGNTQDVVEVLADCDQDAIVIRVTQNGSGACHKGTYSCFSQRIGSAAPSSRVDTPPESAVAAHAPRSTASPDRPVKGSPTILREVYDIILDRKANPKEGSYTCYLFEKGLDKILKKVGEECAETIIGSKNGNPDEVRYEVSDLLYHLLVMLAYHGIEPEEIYAELAGR